MDMIELHLPWIEHAAAIGTRSLRLVLVDPILAIRNMIDESLIMLRTSSVALEACPATMPVVTDPTLPTEPPIPHRKEGAGCRMVLLAIRTKTKLIHEKLKLLVCVGLCSLSLISNGCDVRLREVVGIEPTSLRSAVSRSGFPFALTRMGRSANHPGFLIGLYGLSGGRGWFADPQEAYAATGRRMTP